MILLTAPRTMEAVNPNKVSVDGLLLIDKPAGITSHDAVLIVRRAYGERSIGHLGTLDPFATGLLVLLLGRCTRLASFINNEPKIYEATIKFGAATDTDDCTGTVIRESSVLPDRKSVDMAISSLTGKIQQIPPQYSAKKVDGVRSYDKAREGEEVDLKPVDIEVHSWRVLGMRKGELDVEIVCGGGTYIRALARDLGELTGSAAHLTRLRRTGSGSFNVKDAVSIDTIKAVVPPPPIKKLQVVVEA